MPQGFDAAAATAAYLSTLSPEIHARAQAYTQGGHWLLLWGTLVGVVVAWLILRSGFLTRLRTRIEGRRHRPWLAVIGVIVVYSIIEFILTLPWNVYANWWRETQFGLTSQGFGGWLGEQMMSLAITTVMLSLLLAALYALMRRAPKTWWIWGGGVVAAGGAVVLVLAPVFILPLFNDYTPAPAGPVRDTVVAMANANGVPSDKI